MTPISPATGSLVWHNGLRGVTLCRIASAIHCPAGDHWKLTLAVEQHSCNVGSAYDAGMSIECSELQAIPYNKLKRDHVHIRPYRWADPVTGA